MKSSVRKAANIHTVSFSYDQTAVVAALNISEVSYHFRDTVTFLNFQTLNICCCQPKIRAKNNWHTVMLKINTDRIANSDDPDQTAPIGAI